MDDDTRRVEWEKVEAIAIVIAKNVNFRWPGAEIFDPIFTTNFYGSFPRSFSFAEGVKEDIDFGDQELDEKDPYGVTGYWYRVRCDMPLSASGR
jgi:hypothetical protein